MSKFSYPAQLPCETEWASRSLTELVTHLDQRYRQPTHKRIETIRTLLPQIMPSCDQRREDYHRLATIFTSLCETVEEQVLLKDHILYPAIVKLERGLSSTDQSALDALCEMIMTLDDEHKRLRCIADALGRSVADVTGSPVPVDEAVLASDLDMLALLLYEQLNLEDRCLWPRALILLQRQL